MADFVDTEADDLTVANPSFEEPLGSEWTVGQSKLYYPDATWTRIYSLNARTGEYCMKCELDSSGANYRGSTWFYNGLTNQTTVLGHAYRATVYACEWQPGGAWVLRVQVSDGAGLNEHTDYAPGDISDTGYTACTHDFTGTGDDALRVLVSCMAEDTNAVEFPLIVDDISFTNLSKAGAWAEDAAAGGSWTEDTAADPSWTEVTT